MATAYLSTRGAAGQSAKSRTGTTVDYCEFTVPAAGFVINDTIKLFKLPTMARVLQIVIDIPILDSNVSPATTLDLGDTANGATYYGSALNLGTHNSVAVVFTLTGSGVAGTIGTRYTADDALVLKIHAAPATTATTGTFHCWIEYEMDGGTQTGF